jgi:hypothetical protein
VNPFKELLFLQGHVTQPALLSDAEAPAVEAAPPVRKSSSRPVRLVSPVAQLGGCG